MNHENNNNNKKPKKVLSIGRFLICLAVLLLVVIVLGVAVEIGIWRQQHKKRRSSSLVENDDDILSMPAKAVKKEQNSQKTKDWSPCCYLHQSINNINMTIGGVTNESNWWLRIGTKHSNQTQNKRLNIHKLSWSLATDVYDKIFRIILGIDQNMSFGF